MRSHEVANSNIPYDISAVTSRVVVRDLAELVLWCGSLLAVLVVAALLS